MIIWGSYVIKKLVREGDFHCPNCQTQKRYALLQPRKWGHLYWIPLFVMKEFDSYVECKTCDKAYVEAVLEHDPARDRQQLESNLATMVTQIVALMANARDEPVSVQRAAALFRALTRAEPSAEALMAGSVIVDRDAALQNIARRADILTDGGKEGVLRGMIADGPMGSAAIATIRQIGTSLGLDPERVRGLLAEFG